MWTTRLKRRRNAAAMTDVCVIGGGASGMAAAISARMENPDISISILEKNGRVGKKLLATGNGRCNFTNASCPEFNDIISFFHALGIKERVEQQGRVYPYNGRAEDVLSAFESYLNSHGIEIIPHFPVERLIVGETGKITVCGADREITSGKALLATGGKAGPQFGCTGDGYVMAREAGHSLAKIAPALTPVECIGDFEKLKGLRAKASVTLLKKGVPLAAEEGEVQFTEYGLSGICVFNLSRYIKLEGCGFTDYDIEVDFLPETGTGELTLELKPRLESGYAAPDDLLVSIVPGGLKGFVLSRAGIKPEAGAISGKQAALIAHFLKHLKFTVSNVKGWKSAQCTSGGVPLDEISLDTMESKIVRGLFFAGEMIDYDGPCGGYNLNNAWATGMRAGKAMAANVQDS